MGEHCSNPVGRLQEHSQAKAESSPIYELLNTEGPSHSPIFTMQVFYQGFSATGSSTSKKEAKSKAAQAMLRLIQWGEEGMESRSTQRQGTDGVCMNVVGKLQEQSITQKLGLPVYQDLGMEGPGHMPTFTVSCTVGEWTAQGRGTNKKEAKKNSANFVLQCMMMADIGKEESQSLDMGKEASMEVDNGTIIENGDDNKNSVNIVKLETGDDETKIVSNIETGDTETIEKSTKKDIDETENDDMSSKDEAEDEEIYCMSSKMDTDDIESSNMSNKEKTDDTAASEMPPSQEKDSTDTDEVFTKENTEII